MAMEPPRHHSRIRENGKCIHLAKVRILLPFHFYLRSFASQRTEPSTQSAVLSNYLLFQEHSDSIYLSGFKLQATPNSEVYMSIDE